MHVTNANFGDKVHGVRKVLLVKYFERTRGAEPLTVQVLGVIE